MPQKYSGRVLLILVVLWVALSAMWPRVPGGAFFWIWKDGASTELNLKPGIDMAGGTSLLYEIQVPKDGPLNPNLSVEVMEALKRRVDPDGVKNLIWRPQGATRLEIQMPLSGKEGNVEAVRGRFVQAEQALEQTNVRPADVYRAVEELKGDARRDRLNELAMGSEPRSKLFGAMASVWDRLQAARSAKNVAEDVRLDEEYTKLKEQVAGTNLGGAELQSILDAKPETREAKLKEIKAAASAARAKAVDEFVVAYGQYQQVRGSVGSAADLKRLLKGSGVLEFHILVTDLGTPEARAMVERLQKSGPRVQAGDTMRWYEVDNAKEFHGQNVFSYNDKPYVLAWTTADKQLVNGPGIQKWTLESARADRDPTSGQSIVDFRFDVVGAKYFSGLTGTNINHPLAIVLDNKVISAPNINSQIGATGTISGNFSPQDIAYLVNTLSAGSLPAQLAEEPISERTVGPQLGQDNLWRGLMACAYGLVVVVVFLVGYYYLAGLVAVVAVVLNLILILGSMAAINATFTLPGIAGIVLSVGAAVDANVLIFERLREEQHRGLSLRMALRNAYDRAWSAILDSNVTTLITSLVLYWLGSEEVKGFGLTLLIGLAWSLFTSLFVTKTIFGLLIEHGYLKDLKSLPTTFPKLDEALKPKINWLKIIWPFIGFSTLFIIVGVAAFGAKWKSGEIFDIEFASGTSVQFDTKQAMDRDDVEALVKGQPALEAASVSTVGGGGTGFEVVTPNADARVVRDAVMAAMQGKLNVQESSKYAGMGEPVGTAIEQGVIAPIQTADQKLPAAGFALASLPRHVGGAAIVLKDLSPPLSPREVKERIDRQRLQPRPDGSTLPYREFRVESDGSPDAPAKTVVVLVSDPDLAFDRDEAKWREELVGPMWTLIDEAIATPPQLQRVTNFDPQVAGETAKDALMALVLSIVAIMVYIWVRFGNLKYGTATVVAMVHDTLFVIAALGASHYLAHTAIGRALLIEPFRINLTTVAAILTVMSYSMLDTIVLFDRVRELRGKYGHLSKRIINDAINQTLSRTVLTGGTNLVTVLIMYIMGGPGIHGFTFILFVGILAGTYSSIAIATPLLLIGGGRESETTGNVPIGQPQRVGT
jgi:SecD/SecF fusion protein